MHIKERIDSCLTTLEQRRNSVSVFQAKLRSLIDNLKSEGMTAGALSGLLETLEAVVRNYSEIGASCHQMIEGLREIGEHLTHVEDGRQKILDGVEAILSNLSHLDRLAKNGLQVGATTGRQGGAPKRILLVRITPDATPARPKKPDLTEEDDEDTGGESVVH